MTPRFEPKLEIFSVVLIDKVTTIVDGISDEAEFSGNYKEISKYAKKNRYNLSSNTRKFGLCKFKEAVIGKNSRKLKAEKGDTVIIHKEGTPSLFINGIQCSNQFVSSLDLRYNN